MKRVRGGVSAPGKYISLDPADNLTQSAVASCRSRVGNPAPSPSFIRQAFFIPGPLPGMNDYISTGNRFRYNTDKRKWHDAIAFYIRKAKVKPMQSVYIHFLWQEKHNRRDPDNFSSLGRKWALDALVECGVLVNDGWEQITGWSDSWIVKKEQPGVLITLEER